MPKFLHCEILLHCEGVSLHCYILTHLLTIFSFGKPLHPNTHQGTRHQHLGFIVSSPKKAALDCCGQENPLIWCLAAEPSVEPWQPLAMERVQKCAQGSFSVWTHTNQKWIHNKHNHAEMYTRVTLVELNVEPFITYSTKLCIHSLCPSPKGISVPLSAYCLRLWWVTSHHHAFSAPSQSGAQKAFDSWKFKFKTRLLYQMGARIADCPVVFLWIVYLSQIDIQM